jgi:hypothetical protein
MEGRIKQAQTRENEDRNKHYEMRRKTKKREKFRASM